MQPIHRPFAFASAAVPVPTAHPPAVDLGPRLDHIVIALPSDDPTTPLLPAGDIAAKARPEAGLCRPRGAVRAARQSRSRLLSRLTLDLTAIAAAAGGGKALGDCQSTAGACLLGAALALHVTNTALMAPHWRTWGGRLSEFNAFVCVTTAATFVAQYAKCGSMGGFALGASGLQWLASVCWRCGNNIAESHAAH